MTFAPGKPKTGGRRAGQRNRRTIEAAIAKTDALKYLSDLIDSDDETIGRDLKVKAAICLAGYQRARPAPVQTEMFLTPVDYTAPTTPDEARQTRPHARREAGPWRALASGARRPRRRA